MIARSDRHLLRVTALVGGTYTIARSNLVCQTLLDISSHGLDRIDEVHLYKCHSARKTLLIPQDV